MTIQSYTKQEIIVDISKAAENLDSQSAQNGHRMKLDFEQKLTAIISRLKLYGRVSIVTSFDDHIAKVSNGLLIIVNPHFGYSLEEINMIKEFMAKNGKVLVLTGCVYSQGNASESNINYLLEEFGLSVDQDIVHSSICYKYFDPKESYIRLPSSSTEPPPPHSPLKTLMKHGHESLKSILYVEGCTIAVKAPSKSLLTCGWTCTPSNQCIMAYTRSKETNGIQIIVSGSYKMFIDGYVDKEDNSKLFDTLLKALLENAPFSFKEEDVGGYHKVSNIALVSSMPRSCLDEQEEIEEDKTVYFNTDLLKLDGRLTGSVMNLYKELNIPRERFSTMKPKFEVPLPKMKLAVFPPEFTSHAPPLLELFDFDQEFASDEVKLTKIANKCTDTELKFFIGESAKICGLECDGSDASLRKVLSTTLKAIIKQTVPDSGNLISSAENK